MNTKRAKSYLGALLFLGALSFVRLTFANYGFFSLEPLPEQENLYAEVGTSDNWVTGWTWVEWSGSSSWTYGGTKYHNGSWQDGEIWLGANRTVIDTGRLHESSSDSYGISKIFVSNTSYGYAVARLWNSGDWIGDPSFSQ